MRLALLLLLLVTPRAPAQEQEIQRALLERDQRTAQFAARVQNAPLAEQQWLENSAAHQLLSATRVLPPELRPYERQQAARDAEAFVLRLPPPVARIEVPKELQPRLAPIPPASD